METVCSNLCTFSVSEWIWKGDTRTLGVGDTQEARVLEKKLPELCVYVSEPQKGNVESLSASFSACHSCMGHFVLQIALSFKE